MVINKRHDTIEHSTTQHPVDILCPHDNHKFPLSALLQPACATTRAAHIAGWEMKRDIYVSKAEGNEHKHWAELNLKIMRLNGGAAAAYLNALLRGRHALQC